MPTFNPQPIIQSLAQNESTFRALFSELNQDTYLWRPAPDKWNFLEILCHLCDEEKEDFRARLQSVITDHSQAFTPIDPQGWVGSRKYAEQGFEQKLAQFFEERKRSVSWLNQLEVADWNVAYQHPTFGPMSAAFMLSNWLAHDYLHIRQITHLKFQYLQHISAQSLNYAGDW